MNQQFDWLKELNLLACRFAHLGISADLSGMTVCELFGLYTYLTRLGSIGQ